MVGQFVPQVKLIVLLSEFDDIVGLFSFQVLCFGFFDHVLELSFLVPSGLL